jgi:hypothetical protein
MQRCTKVTSRLARKKNLRDSRDSTFVDITPPHQSALRSDSAPRTLVNLAAIYNEG